MTENKEIYSEKAAGIHQAIDKIIKKPRIPIISNSENNEILALLENYKDEHSRNYIQKYAETEMNNFSSKMGKFSLVIALITLIISFFIFIFSPEKSIESDRIADSNEISNCSRFDFFNHFNFLAFLYTL